MLFKIGVGYADMVVNICLDILARFVPQTFLKISDGSDILSVFVVSKSPSVIDHWIFLVDCKSIR